MTDKRFTPGDGQQIFIGVAWPYANGPQHVGHIAGVYLPCDIFARFQRMIGRKVTMVSGSDTHGTPVTVTAEKQGISPSQVIESFHKRFVESYKGLGITFDHFTHTDTQEHWQTAQELFLAHREHGSLELKKQKQLYDTKGERFLPDRYVEGVCPHCGTDGARGDQCDACGKTYEATELKNPRSATHPDHELEVRETEHFFFKLSDFIDPLKSWMQEDCSHWRSHVLNFSKGQLSSDLLQDRAISRDLSWGINIPLSEYPSKCLYVWYEAVMGYLSATRELGQLQKDEDFWKKLWKKEENTSENPVKHYYFLGKDNIMFHSVLWPAMLQSAGSYNLPYEVVGSEYLNSYGEKFSKSKGIIIGIEELLEKFQPDSIRYALAAMAPESSDTDFTWDDFEEKINNELAANWGNLVQRALTFTYRKLDKKVPTPGEFTEKDLAVLKAISEGFESVGDLYDRVKLKGALLKIRDLSSQLNQYLSDTAPWKVIKEDRARTETIMYVTLQCVDWLKTMWYPILPHSSQQLNNFLGFDGALGGEQFTKEVEDERGTHLVLGYTPTHEMLWKKTTLPAGQPLNDPSILFQKIDLKKQ